jgi:adenosylcobinamide amidohydrolase
MTFAAPVLVDDLGLTDARAALVRRLDEPMLSIASTPLGGGIGIRAWVVNAQVDQQYARTDVESHLASIAAHLGCTGDGVGFLTAADVSRRACGSDGDVRVHATVGLRDPTWAAADATEPVPAVGTINIVCGVPVRLSEAALVNAVATVTEAKAQALADAGIAGTGTASDAVCVVCPTGGPVEQFAGPRSTYGARIARAAHAAVAEGSRTWLEWASS